LIAAGGLLQCGYFWRQVAKVIGRLPRRRGTARPSRNPRERYGRRSTIITSQIPVDKWHALIGDPTYADAILDRIVHNAHRINLTGHSLRRSRASKTSKG